MTLVNYKKGIGAGAGVIMGIVVLLVFLVVITSVIVSKSSDLDEELQVNLCRISNEINFGIIEKATFELFSGPRICNTIDKTKGDSRVPAKGKYPQTKEGVQADVRDMIASCWYMWLEGSKENTFNEFPNTEACFTCYQFEVKKNVVDTLSFDELATSLNAPYFASDSSDRCDDRGGFWRDTCDEIEGENLAYQKKNPEGKSCCIRTDALDECGNKGGQCHTPTEDKKNPENYPYSYDNWLCPNNQQCFVKNDENLFTYGEYIYKFGELGGDIFLIPPKDVGDGDESSEPIKYAISFFSAGKQGIGGYGGITLFFNDLDPIKFITEKIPIVDELDRLTREAIYAPILEGEKNLLVVSTKKTADKFGCTIT